MSRATACGVLLLAGILAACARSPGEAKVSASWVATIRPEGLKAPIGVGVAGGSLWVSEPAGPAVSRGDLGEGGGGRALAGLSDRVFLPMHLAVAGGRVLLPDYLGDRVVVVSLRGAVVRSFGEPGAAAGQLDAPAGVALAPDGSAYVADFNHHRIVRFDREGRPAGGWGRKGHAGPGEFYYPTDVAVGREGRVYVADAYNDRVQVFSSDGSFVRSWGEKGQAPGEFDVPVGIGIDHEGRVLVADQFNHRIQVFSPEGGFLAAWGGPGAGEGRFDRPSDVAFDERGRVYVADYGNRRVQVFELVQGGD